MRLILRYRTSGFQRFAVAGLLLILAGGLVNCSKSDDGDNLVNDVLVLQAMLTCRNYPTRVRSGTSSVPSCEFDESRLTLTCGINSYNPISYFYNSVKDFVDEAAFVGRINYTAVAGRTTSLKPYGTQLLYHADGRLNSSERHDFGTINKRELFTEWDYANRYLVAEVCY